MSGNANNSQLRAQDGLMVFDFDGVIINSEPLMRQAYEHACQRCRVDEPPRVEAFLACMGMPLPQIVACLQLPAAFTAEYQSYCRSHMQLVTLYPGLQAVLSLTRHQFSYLALMTGKDRLRTELLLRRFGLTHVFDTLVCGDDPFPGKPDPAGLRHLLRYFEVSPEETCMIGDSAIDIRCGLGATVRTVGAGWGFSSVHDLAECGAQLVFERPEHFADWLAWSALDGMGSLRRGAEERQGIYG